MPQHAFLASDADQAAIAAAVARAESSTSGEIVVVLARASDDHLFVTLAWAALLALLAPLPLDLAGGVGAVAAHGLQLLVFCAAAPLLRLPYLRRLTVPKPMQRAAAARQARAQFLEQGLHRTRDRAGVLIYVSEIERIVEILADDGIARLSPPDTWDGIVRRFVEEVRDGRRREGLLAAIEAVGMALAEHFPRRPDDVNELPDKPVVL